jgi:hypothetical protein
MAREELEQQHEQIGVFLDQTEPVPPPPPPSNPPPQPDPLPPGTFGLWSWDAAKTALDPDPALTAALQANLRSPNLAMTSWAVATAEAKAGDPEYPIPRTDQGGAISCRIPVGTRPDPSGDGHLTVRDVERGLETDFWGAVYDPNTKKIAKCKAAVTYPLGAVNTGKGWSGDAANTPLLRGLVTPEAILAGSVGQTLQFSVPNIPNGLPKYPATHNVPTNNMNSVVEGTYIDLDQSIDVKALHMPRWAEVIALDLQKFGGVNRDNGGTFCIYGRNPLNPGQKQWSEVGLSGGSVALPSNFPIKGLRVKVPPKP